MNNVIDMRTRRPVVYPHLVQYDDVRLEFARQVERRFHEIESVMSGDATPCDVQPEGAD